MTNSFFKILLFIFFTGIMFFLTKSYDQERIEKFQHFNKAKIEGKIVTIDVGAGHVYLTIENDSVVYAFKAITNENNKGRAFSDIAQKGDKVFKLPYAKKIELFSDNQKYNFAIFNPETYWTQDLE